MKLMKKVVSYIPIPTCAVVVLNDGLNLTVPVMLKVSSLNNQFKMIIYSSMQKNKTTIPVDKQKKIERNQEEQKSENRKCNRKEIKKREAG